MSARTPLTRKVTKAMLPRAPRLLCCVCRRKPVEANGRCKPCRLYRWRHGHDRPPELIEKEIEREARKVAALLKRTSSRTGVP